METLTAEAPQISEPKSYLSQEERERILREYSPNSRLLTLYMAERAAARDAGDRDSSWAWLAKIDLPAHSLMFMKRNHGADFIRKWGFKTAEAERVYGADWLEKEYEL